jgi:hypothetical protein
VARTILITFADNKAAAEFARDFASAQKTTCSGTMIHIEGVTMDAMIARPTLYCRCTPTMRRRGRQKELGDFTQAEKFGWYIHALCQRPTKYVVEHWLQHRIAGNKDLLPGVLGRGESVPQPDADLVLLQQRQEMTS